MRSILLILMAASYSHCMPQECSKPNTSGARISVSSHRNGAGQWTPQVHLQHNVSHGQTTTGLWKLDVDQNVVKCGDSEIVNVYVKLTPPSKDKTRLSYELVPQIGYYKLHTRSVPWEEARKICESEEAHLAIINSQDEAGALKKIIAKYPNTVGWIHVGFHDKDTEGQFVTVLGGPLKLSGYYVWKPNEPNSLGGNEDCGSISLQAQLNDINCQSSMNFIYVGRPSVGAVDHPPPVLEAAPELPGTSSGEEQPLGDGAPEDEGAASSSELDSSSSRSITTEEEKSKSLC